MTFAKMVEKARAAGFAAGQAVNPHAMVVYEAAGITGDAPKEGGQSWVIPDGVCGFAWVSIKGTTAFARWAKSKGLVSKAHPSGYWFWVGEFNQSYERKMAFAEAFAKVLNQHGIEAHASGRLD